MLTSLMVRARRWSTSRIFHAKILCRPVLHGWTAVLYLHFRHPTPLAISRLNWSLSCRSWKCPRVSEGRAQAFLHHSLAFIFPSGLNL